MSNTMIYGAIVLVMVLVLTVNARPSEPERVRLWYEKGNTWPPKWQDETPAMKEVLRRREAEIMQLTGADERWENWLQFVQNRLVPKFTPVGFELTRTPAHIQKKLRDMVDKRVGNFDGIRDEGDIDVIYNRPDKLPKFIDLGPLAWEILEDLRPAHEAWAGGIELIPSSAYGIRLYQNESSLVMHYDKIETHVISSIIHIAHSYDDDNVPWPIEIEDHDGKVHIYDMKEGDQVFYESAKALHGRMSVLKGKYYASIFIHYRPKDKSIWNYTHEDVIASVPPHWRRGITEEHGSRYSGASLSIDSRVCVNAGPRVINGRMALDDHRPNYEDHPYRAQLEDILQQQEQEYQNSQFHEEL